MCQALVPGTRAEHVPGTRARHLRCAANVADVIRSIELVLGLKLAPQLDTNGNQCPDVCE